MSNTPAIHPDLKELIAIQEENKKLDSFPAELEPEWSLGKLYDAYRAVVDLKAGTKKWPFKLAWQVDDLTELFKPYAIKFETRQQGLLAQFAKPADAQSTQPGEFAFTLLQPEEYRVALQELTSTIPTEFKPEKIKPISVSELETVATLEVSSEAIRILRYLGLVTS